MSDTQTMDLFTTQIEKQEEYTNQLEAKGENSFSLVAAEAFVKSMRDSGYKSTATALDELVDNADEAGASQVDIVYTKDGRYVSDLAVVDNGHGMTPTMIRAAVLWGGTHRWNSREGFGRYGFGLPSAAVSITKHYEVYSKTEGGEWHYVPIDIEAIARGEFTNEDGVVVPPKPEPAQLPDFVKQHLGDRLPMDHGTVVFLKNPDRLSSGFKTHQAFHRNMMHNLGRIYRGMLRDLEIYVGTPSEGQKVQPVDPLFLMPNARGYDAGNGVFAEELDPMRFTVENSETGEEGTVTIRFSHMPPTFQHKDPDNPTRGEEIPERFKVMKDANAFFLVARAGREIDTVTTLKFPKESENYTLVNYDRNWAIELNFDPVLDEEFGITVNKQQVTLTNRMWQILDKEGLPAAIRNLRKLGKEARNKQKADEDKERPKPSEKIMEESEKFRTRPKKSTEEQKKKAQERVEKDAEKIASETDRPTEDVVEEIVEETQEKPYEVHFEELKGAPFYRTEQYGGQVRLYINTSHRFYSDVYAQLSDDSARDRRLKIALELLLFVLGSCELEAPNKDKAEFYLNERMEWSRRYGNTLSLLDDIDSILDAESAREEMAELFAE